MVWCVQEGTERPHAQVNMDNSHNIKFPYSRDIYIRNKRYSEGILVWRARISNQTGFNGEYYASVKTKRYDAPTGGRALVNMFSGSTDPGFWTYFGREMFQTWRKQRYPQVIICIKLKNRYGKWGGVWIKASRGKWLSWGNFPSGVYENKQILTSSEGRVTMKE
jgi:hypothetical protein